jgi:hypothetical protein
MVFVHYTEQVKLINRLLSLLLQLKQQQLKRLNIIKNQPQQRENLTPLQNPYYLTIDVLVILMLSLVAVKINGYIHLIMIMSGVIILISVTGIQ